MEELNEKEIAESLFGKASIKTDIKHMKSPSALTLFCRDNRKSKFVGHQIKGFMTKFCQEFYSTQTDVGVCSSKNSLQILKDSKIIAKSNEHKLDDTVRNMEHTFFIKVNNFVPTSITSAPRTNHGSLGIQMQIHQDKDYSKILFGGNVEESLKSISLLPGNEYLIELKPYGQRSTADFQKLPIEQRRCRLDTETLQGSTYKIYSKQNCIYDCFVTKAYEDCKCIPWDFVTNINATECDIFGRTCFFTVMEQLTHKSEDQCPNCMDECDWVKYPKLKIEKESIKIVPRIENKYETYGTNKYMATADFAVHQGYVENR